MILVHFHRIIWIVAWSTFYKVYFCRITINSNERFFFSTSLVSNENQCVLFISWGATEAFIIFKLAIFCLFRSQIQSHVTNVKEKRESDQIISWILNLKKLNLKRCQLTIFYCVVWLCVKHLTFRFLFKFMHFSCYFTYLINFNVMWTAFGIIFFFAKIEIFHFLYKISFIKCFWSITFVTSGAYMGELIVSVCLLFSFGYFFGCLHSDSLRLFFFFLVI